MNGFSDSAPSGAYDNSSMKASKLKRITLAIQVLQTLLKRTVIVIQNRKKIHIQHHLKVRNSIILNLMIISQTIIFYRKV